MVVQKQPRSLFETLAYLGRDPTASKDQAGSSSSSNNSSSCCSSNNDGSRCSSTGCPCCGQPVVVLASQSPQRSNLLRQHLGLPLTIITSNYEDAAKQQQQQQQQKDDELQAERLLQQLLLPPENSGCTLQQSCHPQQQQQQRQGCSKLKALALRKAHGKAADIAAQLWGTNSSSSSGSSSSSSGCRASSVIVSADTVVDVDGCLMEKPEDAAAAARMLQQLQGRSHWVHTAVCIYTRTAYQQQQQQQQQRGAAGAFVCSTRVTFWPLCSEDIQRGRRSAASSSSRAAAAAPAALTAAHWAAAAPAPPAAAAAAAEQQRQHLQHSLQHTGQQLRRRPQQQQQQQQCVCASGGYGLQGLGCCLVAAVEGCSNCVVGLPVSHLLAALASLHSQGLL
ncbi:septum formation protein maf, putative [Eimeria tenella]|uniref:Septum formation protein maf, putative n=1 Tax=Eimeria tenella TaxID=5802 RepID=U6KGH2_EIMTE|nr:septum formation protein maf, putative [Eimeria tenella]CDJ37145.1 septum formation protein maf, putative [Eimeria tenella]|eukprot:XP_013227983.1 septum formation protein maf, putative [Eimeria tenella]